MVLTNNMQLKVISKRLRKSLASPCKPNAPVVVSQDHLVRVDPLVHRVSQVHLALPVDQDRPVRLPIKHVQLILNDNRLRAEHVRRDHQALKAGQDFPVTRAPWVLMVRKETMDWTAHPDRLAHRVQWGIAEVQVRQAIRDRHPKENCEKDHLETKVQLDQSGHREFQDCLVETVLQVRKANADGPVLPESLENLDIQDRKGQEAERVNLENQALVFARMSIRLFWSTPGHSHGYPNKLPIAMLHLTPIRMVVNK